MMTKRFEWQNQEYHMNKIYDNEKGGVVFDEDLVDLLNKLHEENQLLQEEKELLYEKLDRIEDILPHYLSCAEICEFRSKIVKQDIALMKCWNKKYQKR